MSTNPSQGNDLDVVKGATWSKPLVLLLLAGSISLYGLSNTVRNKVDGIVGSLPQSTVDLIHKSREKIAKLIGGEDK